MELDTTPYYYEFLNLLDNKKITKKQNDFLNKIKNINKNIEEINKNPKDLSKILEVVYEELKN